MFRKVADVKREQELMERRKNDPPTELARDHPVRKLFSRFRRMSDRSVLASSPSAGGNALDSERGSVDYQENGVGIGERQNSIVVETPTIKSIVKWDDQQNGQVDSGHSATDAADSNGSILSKMANGSTAPVKQNKIASRWGKLLAAADHRQETIPEAAEETNESGGKTSPYNLLLNNSKNKSETTYTAVEQLKKADASNKTTGNTWATDKIDSSKLSPNINEAQAKPVFHITTADDYNAPKSLNAETSSAINEGIGTGSIKSVALPARSNVSETKTVTLATRVDSSSIKLPSNTSAFVTSLIEMRVEMAKDFKALSDKMTQFDTQLAEFLNALNLPAVSPSTNQLNSIIAINSNSSLKTMTGPAPTTLTLISALMSTDSNDKQANSDASSGISPVTSTSPGGIPNKQSASLSTVIHMENPLTEAANLSNVKQAMAEEDKQAKAVSRLRNLFAGRSTARSIPPTPAQSTINVVPANETTEIHHKTLLDRPSSSLAHRRAAVNQVVTDSQFNDDLINID